MHRRAFGLLFGALGLAGCAGGGKTGAVGRLNQAPVPAPAPAGGQEAKVSILLPLTGQRADIGASMARAARLALDAPGAPVPDIRDTAGSADGAAKAAQDAIAAGATVILGPLSSAETARVAPIARQAGVPVLAFTNDPGQAQPGVWPLGITPDQQIGRLAEVLRQTKHEPIAALLPDNELGRAMSDALIRASGGGGAPPFIRLHGAGKDAISAIATELMNMAQPGEPLPFGAILLGTYGADLRLFAKAFADAKIDRAKVQIVGPALWAEPASGSGAVWGAWFAGPDPDARKAFVKDYVAKYKDGPRPVADLAYDAAAIVRVLSARNQLTAAGLTQALGFTGADGWFALRPDGQVTRGLAVFKVDKALPVRIFDAPNGPAPAGS